MTKRSVRKRLGWTAAIAAIALVTMGAAPAPAHAAGTAPDAAGLIAGMHRALEPAKDMRANFILEMDTREGEPVRWAGHLVRRGKGDETRIAMTFDHPADLEGTEVAVLRRAGTATRTRLYLPALRRVRDIEADTRGESFLGTDFNYEDLGLEDVQYEHHVLASEKQVTGRACREVESKPTHGWWYGAIDRCIDDRTALPLRTEYYDRNGILWKVRTLDKIEDIQGHPTPTRITMTTVPTGTATHLVLSDVRYDTGIPDALFQGRARIDDLTANPPIARRETDDAATSR